MATNDHPQSLIRDIYHTQDVEHFVLFNPMDAGRAASVIVYGSCEPPEGATMCRSRQLDSPPALLRDDGDDNEIQPSDSVSNVGVSRSDYTRNHAVAMAARTVLRGGRGSSSRSLLTANQ